MKLKEICNHGKFPLLIKNLQSHLNVACCFQKENRNLLVACFIKEITIVNEASRVIRIIIVSDVTAWSSVTLLELPITLLENIYSTGVTHDNCHLQSS